MFRLIVQDIGSQPFKPRNTPAGSKQLNKVEVPLKKNKSESVPRRSCLWTDIYEM